MQWTEDLLAGALPYDSIAGGGVVTVFLLLNFSIIIILIL